MKIRLWSRNQHLLTLRQNFSSRIRHRSHQGIFILLLSLAPQPLASKSQKELFWPLKEDLTQPSLYPKASKKYSKSIHTFAALPQASLLTPEPSSSTEESRLWITDTLTSNQSLLRRLHKPFLIWLWTLVRVIHLQRRNQCPDHMVWLCWLQVSMKTAHVFIKQIHQEQWFSTRPKVLALLMREFNQF